MLFLGFKIVDQVVLIGILFMWFCLLIEIDCEVVIMESFGVVICLSGISWVECIFLVVVVMLKWIFLGFSFLCRNRLILFLILILLLVRFIGSFVLEKILSGL